MQIAMFPFASVLFKTLLSFLDNLWTNSGKFQFVTGTCDRNLTLTFNHETAEAHKRSLTAIETHWSRQWSHVVPPCKTIIYNYKKLMPLHADDSAEPITKPKISRPSCLLENNCRWCEWSYWAIVLKWKKKKKTRRDHGFDCYQFYLVASWTCSVGLEQSPLFSINPTQLCRDAGSF